MDNQSSEQKMVNFLTNIFMQTFQPPFNSKEQYYTPDNREIIEQYVKSII